MRQLVIDVIWTGAEILYWVEEPSKLQFKRVVLHIFIRIANCIIPPFPTHKLSDLLPGYTYFFGDVAKVSSVKKKNIMKIYSYV